jgi:hypothetical protein
VPGFESALGWNRSTCPLPEELPTRWRWAWVQAPRQALRMQGRSIRVCRVSPVRSRLMSRSEQAFDSRTPQRNRHRELMSELASDSHTGLPGMLSNQVSELAFDSRIVRRDMLTDLTSVRAFDLHIARRGSASAARSSGDCRALPVNHSVTHRLEQAFGSRIELRDPTAKELELATDSAEGAQTLGPASPVPQLQTLRRQALVQVSESESE